MKYPRLITMFPGILVVARDEEHYKQLRKNDFAGVWLFIVGMCITIFSMAVWYFSA